MENKDTYQKELFTNRIKKNYKERRKWARKNRISCYRLYDKDIPEIPLSLDIYEFLPETVSTPVECAKFLTEQSMRISANDPSIEKEIEERRYAVLYLYERPYEKPVEEEKEWLNLMCEAASQVLNINPSHIIQKMRKQQKGLNQYEKADNFHSITGLTQEQGQIFKIDLSTYLDTGLFFDHRPLRSLIRETAGSKSVLNLFCYTGSFSVYAASANAKKVESVDLSNTYLSWAKENMELNGFSEKSKYIYTRSDCVSFLQEKAVAQKAVIAGTADADQKKNAQLYDIIILDPPTFSNSKNTSSVLDINKDWPQLVKDCLNILNPKGILYFSTNSERLKFDIKALPPKTISGLTVNAEDITPSSIPEDYKGSRPHKCYKLYLS